MPYYIEWATSRSFQRTFAAPPVSQSDGPYKRLRWVKRKVAEMRKARTIADCNDGHGWRDFGPMYSSVKIVEGDR